MKHYSNYQMFYSFKLIIFVHEYVLKNRKKNKEKNPKLKSQ